MKRWTRFHLQVYGTCPSCGKNDHKAADHECPFIDAVCYFCNKTSGGGLPQKKERAAVSAGPPEPGRLAGAGKAAPLFIGYINNFN